MPLVCKYKRDFQTMDFRYYRAVNISVEDFETEYNTVRVVTTEEANDYCAYKYTMTNGEKSYIIYSHNPNLFNL